MTNGGFYIYDSEKFLEQLEEFPEEYKETVKLHFGINSDKRYSLKEAGEKLGISLEMARNREAYVLRQLRHPARGRCFMNHPICKIVRKLNNDGKGLSKEEKEIAEEIKDIFLNSNSIFYPDQEYAQEEMDIDKKRYFKLINRLEEKEKQEYKRQEEEKQKYEQEKIIIPSTTIEELNFSKRGFNCLKRAKINTVKDLLDLSYDEISNIRNLGNKTLKEIMHKIEEVEPLVQEEPENVEVETKIEDKEKLEIKYDDSEWEFIFEDDEYRFEEETEQQEETTGPSELVVLKAKIAELTEKSNSLQEQLKEAKELLESYEKLANGTTQADDNSNPDFKD